MIEEIPRHLIMHKLETGEDALDLSIKIWEHKLVAVRDMQNTHLIRLGEDYCPLCIKYRSTDINYCGACPLAINGFKCSEDGSVYQDVFTKYVCLDRKTGEYYTREQKEMATQNMLNLLKMCKRVAEKRNHALERVTPFVESEVKHRMKENYDVYDLSVEIWTARKNYVALGGNMDCLQLGSALCPLCLKFYNNMYYSRGDRCERCPLHKIGEGCKQSSSPYKKVISVKNLSFIPMFIKRHLVVKAMDRMIRTIKEAKCMNR